MESIFVKRLKMLQEESGLSNSAFAKEIGICRKTLESYYKGITEPKLKVLRAISKRYDISSDFLVGLSDDRDRKRKLK